MSEGSLEERSEEEHTSRTDGRIFGNSGFRDGKIVGEKIRWDAGHAGLSSISFQRLRRGLSTLSLEHTRKDYLVIHETWNGAGVLLA